MYKAVLEFGSFNDSSSLEYREEALGYLLEAWVAINMAYLVRCPNVPPMYTVFPQYTFKVRPLDFDHWQDIQQTIDLQSGDCKDFAAWRVAELRLQGHNVACHIVSSQVNDLTVYHVQVVNLDTGEIEDPSAILGMPPAASYEQLRYGN